MHLSHSCCCLTSQHAQPPSTPSPHLMQERLPDLAQLCSPLHVCALLSAGTCFMQASQHCPGVVVWNEEPHFTTSPHNLQQQQQQPAGRQARTLKRGMPWLACWTKPRSMNSIICNTGAKHGGCCSSAQGGPWECLALCCMVSSPAVLVLAGQRQGGRDCSDRCRRCTRRWRQRQQCKN